MNPSLVVVVPVYGNADTLEPLVARLHATLDPVEDWRVHLVVDACPRGSGPVALRLADSDHQVRTTVLPVNAGQHQALRAGLLAEPDAGTWVCMDADLQDPPEALPGLLAVLRSGDAAGVFAGRRGAYESAGRRVTGTLHRRALRALTGLPPDAGAFLALDPRLRNRLLAAMDHGAPSIVAAAGRSGLPLRSVPVRRHERPSGSTAWTGRARLQQSVRTLAWAARA